MSKSLKVVATIVFLALLSLGGVVLAQTFKSGTQPTTLIDEKTPLVEKIQSSPDHPLLIKEDADAPMKILSVGVKEISRDDYQKLTGKITELSTLYSVPEASLKNTSDKTITTVFFITRDLSTSKLKGMMMKDVSIEPGQTFNIRRGGTVKTDSLTVAGNDGTVRELTKESMTNENYWLPFTNIDQLQVSVVVTFADGSKWANRERVK
jgi:hypothetical protein